MSKKSESVKRIQRRKKRFAVEAFGGKCEVCGYDKCLNALEFHHIEGKMEKPSYIIMRWSWERAQKELEKCMLLCSNCHRELHYLDLDDSVQVDVSSRKRISLHDAEQEAKLRYAWINTECLQCHVVFATKNTQQKYCSQRCCQLDRHKVIRPSKHELQELMNNRVSFSAMGRAFGVSDNAVRKWAKKYGIL